jgi:hypothetical protein
VTRFAGHSQRRAHSFRDPLLSGLIVWSRSEYPGLRETVHLLVRILQSTGVTLSEAKELLREVQRAMVTHQTIGYVTQQIDLESKPA